METKKHEGSPHVSAGFEGLTVGKCDFEFEEAAFPHCLVLARDSALPLLNVHRARLRVAHGFREEAERVVASPLLPVDVVSWRLLFVRACVGLTSPPRGGSCTASTW